MLDYRIMKEQQSLEQLGERAEAFSNALKKVDQTKQDLGTKEGPQRLFYGDLEGAKRRDIVIKVGAIKRNITTRTQPLLEKRRNQIVEELIQSTSAKAEAELSEMRDLASEGFVPSEELELAEAEIRQTVANYREGSISYVQLINTLVGSPSPESNIVTTEEIEPSTDEEHTTVVETEPNNISSQVLLADIPQVTEDPGYRFNEETHQYEIPLPDGQMLTTTGEKKAKVLCSLIKKNPNIDELAEMLETTRSNAGAWLAVLKKDKDLKALDWEVYYAKPEVRTRTSKGVYHLNKIVREDQQDSLDESTNLPVQLDKVNKGESQTQVEDAEVKNQGLSSEEIFMLNSLIEERTVLIAPNHVQLALQNLKIKAPGNLGLTEEQRIELKSRTLGKLTELINSQEINKAIESVDHDQQVVIRWLYLLDHKVDRRGMVLRFLSENTNRLSPTVKEWLEQIQRVEISQAEPEIAPDEENPIVEVSETQQLVLSAYLDDINIDMKEIISILSMEQQISSEEEAKEMVINIASNIRSRIENGIGTDEEVELWGKIENLCKGEAGILEQFCKEQVNESLYHERSFDMGDSKSKIELRDPEVRSKVTQIISEIKSKNIPRQFTIFELRGLFFGNLRLDDINQANRNGFIHLEHDIKTSYHPSVPHEEAATFIYYWRNRNAGYNLSPKLMDQIRTMVIEEMRRLEEEQTLNSNGQ